MKFDFISPVVSENEMFESVDDILLLRYWLKG